MTNAELIQKIRNEIERQMNFYDGKEREVLDDPKQFTYALLYQGHQRMCAKLLSFLSTLESEKPMNLDLEIEIEDYVEQRWRFAEDLKAAVPIYLYDMTLNELKDCARHFAKWGAEHAPLPEDTVIYQKGVEEGKRLMMEEAVEGKIAERIQGKLYARCQVPKTMGGEFGDKVRIIILPKEDDNKRKSATPSTPSCSQFHPPT